MPDEALDKIKAFLSDTSKENSEQFLNQNLDAQLKELNLETYNLADDDPRTNLCGVIYGTTGVGKTWQATTFGSRVLYINVERGDRTLRRAPITGVNIRDILSLAKILAALKKDLEANSSRFDTLFIDSATDLYKQAIKAETQKAAQANPKQDSDVPSQREYLKVGSKVDRVLNFAKELPIDVIFTAIEDTAQDDNGVESLTPAMSPYIRNSFFMYSDFILHMAVGKDGIRNMLRTAPAPRIKAKLRAPYGMQVPSVITNPNLAHLMDCIRGTQVEFDTPDGKVKVN